MQLTIPRTRRDLLFIGFLIATIAIYFVPLGQVLALSLDSAEYSHFIIIPFISAWFAFTGRGDVGSNIRYSFRPGAVVIAAATILHIAGRFLMPVLNLNDHLSIIMFSAVAFIAGGCILFYGTQSFRRALFPIGFLLFTVPVPSPFFNGLIHLMQVGSAEVANWLLPITGTTFVRDGLTFHLTTMSVTVAEECSGIRGTMAILITAVIAGKLMLRTGWSRLAIALLVLPISFFKNGVRVATLAYLAGNVDTKFVTNSSLHSDGGMIFFALGLLVMFPLLWLLRVVEGKAPAVAKHRR